MLWDRIGDLERKSVKDAAVDAAKLLLEAAPGRVTGFMTSSSLIHWKASKDRSGAGRVRREILEVLAGLAGR